MSHDPTILPANLPVPVDDGSCMHLRGVRLPSIVLPCTDGSRVALDRIAPAGGCVLFFYPRTGVPGQPPGPGFAGEEWDSIPGARGCTPQSCGFRDLHARFTALGVRVLGVSTNTTGHQAEFQQRMHVPFDFLSDAELLLTRALNLPTFRFPVESGGPDTLLQRMAWFAAPDHGGSQRIVKVWYPVFPPDGNAQNVLTWLERRRAIEVRPVTAAEDDFRREVLIASWVSTRVASRGHWYPADRIPALVAFSEGRPVGLVTYAFTEEGCEVVTLNARESGRAIGSALLDAVEGEARRAGCRRLFLTTSNDNMRALTFYQVRGWRLLRIWPGMIDKSREVEKPIPRVGHAGIPIHDEIELEYHLPD